MVKTVFSVPRDQRYFEDYLPGSVYEFGSVTVTEEEVIEFAKKYDPQPFHTDPEAAKKTHFGGLVASGWLTAGLMMRLLVDHYVSAVASEGSPGVENLRWFHPVRPGDELSIRVTINEARRSRSKPERGFVAMTVEVLNQRREAVMTLQSTGMVRSRGGQRGQSLIN